MMAPPPAPAPPRLGMPETIGFAALVFYVFAITSSVPDLIPGLAMIRPSLLTAVLGLSVVGITGRAATLAKHPVALCLIALTIWFVICIPFAVWPGGAFQTLTNQWLISFLTLFMVGGLIWNADQCRKITNVIGYSGVILACIAQAYNQLDNEGRLHLKASRHGNSNELAMIGLTTLPFLAFMAMRKGNGIRRLLGLAGVVPVLLMIAKTGSRGALIAATLAILVLFLSVSMGQKVKLIVASVAVLVGLVTILPARLTSRFITVFGDNKVSVQDSEMAAAVGSAEARRMLLLDSLTVTGMNPLFGVGVGNFMVSQADLAKARGEAKGYWHVTHNSYTQVSSESGLFGLILFLAAIVACFRSISRTLKMKGLKSTKAGEDLWKLALALRVSFSAFVVYAFFDSSAYSTTVTLFMGFAISLESCSRALVTSPVASPTARPVAPGPAMRGFNPRPAMGPRRPVRQLPARI